MMRQNKIRLKSKALHPKAKVVCNWKGKYSEIGNQFAFLLQTDDLPKSRQVKRAVQPFLLKVCDVRFNAKQPAQRRNSAHW
jgi:hypothetical protein